MDDTIQQQERDVMMEMFSQEMGVLLPVLLKQLMNVLFHLSGNLYVRKFVEMEN